MRGYDSIIAAVSAQFDSDVVGMLFAIAGAARFWVRGVTCDAAGGGGTGKTPAAARASSVCGASSWTI